MKLNQECKKCGSKDASATYSPTTEILKNISNKFKHETCLLGGMKEEMGMQCRVCGYTWIEEPLDNN